MKRREVEVGDTVRFKLKLVRRGHAPKGRFHVVEIADGTATLRREPGRMGPKGGKRVRTAPVSDLAVDVTVEERVARELMR